MVRSSEATTAGGTLLARRIEAAGREAAEAFPGAGMTPVDVYRGDGWQVALERPRLALRVALFLRCRLRQGEDGVDTRVSIGIGPVEHLPKRRVSRGDGPAFRLSGRGLEEMDPRRLMAWAEEPAVPAADPLFALLDAVTGRWTARQCLAVAGALQGWSQERIGSAWTPAPIAQPTVGGHLESASWRAVEAALDFFEARERE
ncbi:MAG: hypothetical protein EA425_15375 [Puniceicoccaceae bacterium]|nr:MAG: hypothetical protein EA425_15375 [Puniceicoccaceae bacterium]